MKSLAIHSCAAMAVTFVLFTTTASAQIGGIVIDAEGVVTASPQKRISRSALERLQETFAAEHLSPALLQQSAARVLSLKQLNDAVRDALDSEEEFPVTLRYLAGLQRIDYVIVNPANDDMLFVGPAEGFGPGRNSDIEGVTTGRPPMQLDDLIIALRSIYSGQREIGVSIDPTEQNMSNLQNYIRQNSNATTTQAAQRRYLMMGKILGYQTVSLWGVPEDSHFAVALTAADLSMKRIALGLDPSGVRGIRSHLALLLPQGNSMQRWWFMPYYEPLGTNDERTIFEIKGQRAQLMAQEERVNFEGQRQDAPFTRLTTQKFAQLFTEHFEELAKVNPVFAELQSLYDLSLAASLVRKQWPSQTEAMGIDTLLNDKRLPLKTYPVPKSVPSASTYRKSSRGLLIGLIGGVTIDMGPVVNQTRTNPNLNSERFQPQSQNSGWWWSAEPVDSVPSADRLPPN